MSRNATGSKEGGLMESHFEVMARRPGGMSQEEALRNAQKRLLELKPSVTQFVEKECDELLTALASSQEDTSDRGAQVARAFACSQNIRDVAEVADYALVGLVAKSLCDLFELLTGFDIDYPLAVVDCHIDALRLARRAEYRNKQVDECAAQLAEALALTVKRVCNTPCAPGSSQLITGP